MQNQKFFSKMKGKFILHSILYLRTAVDFLKEIKLISVRLWTNFQNYVILKENRIILERSRFYDA